MAGCVPEATKPKPAENGIAETPQELASEAGIPIYPGASFPEGKSNVRSADKETRYELVMASSDAESKVKAFYMKHLKLREIPDTKSLMGATPDGALAKIDVLRHGKVTRIVAITVRESK
jgi:hypothetical protein